MAYDRYDPRDDSRRWRDERDDRFHARDRAEQARGDHGDRGFFERAGDEIASWFGDDDAERRRREDQRMEGRERGDDDRSWRRDEPRGRAYGRDHEREWERGRSDWDRGRSDRFYGEDRGPMSRSPYRGDFGGAPEDQRSAGGYRPMFGGYTAAEGLSGPDTSPRPDYGREWESSQRRRFSSERDPHYHSWRQRQIDELDRDYDDYRRENQSRFESDFGSWRERRMQKRSMLGRIREHMEVVGNDDQHVGTVDRVAGDRIILTKSDPESGGAHHSLSCADIDRVEGDRVILDCSADQARERWRDESRSRALFEREDQGEMGDRALNRSFEGTYR
jgi:hypothetical protein